jgi:hypothetical protein
MLLFQTKKNSSNQESNSGNVGKEKEVIKQHDGLVVVNKLSAKSVNGKGNEEEQVSNNPCYEISVSFFFMIQISSDAYSWRKMLIFFLS